MADELPNVMSPADVAAKLVELSAAYNAERGAPKVHELDAATAGQRLADMTKAYREANQPKHSAADTALVGEARPEGTIETTTWPEQNTRNKLSAINSLREIGIPDEGIAMIIRGDEFPAADVATAQQWKRNLMNNPELRNLILSGDREARHVLTGMSAIIAGGTKER